MVLTCFAMSGPGQVVTTDGTINSELYQQNLILNVEKQPTEIQQWDQK